MGPQPHYEVPHYDMGPPVFDRGPRYVETGPAVFETFGKQPPMLAIGPVGLGTLLVTHGLSEGT
jgi:hypothetical protein